MCHFQPLRTTPRPHTAAVPPRSNCEAEEWLQLAPPSGLAVHSLDPLRRLELVVDPCVAALIDGVEIRVRLGLVRLQHVCARTVPNPETDEVRVARVAVELIRVRGIHVEALKFVAIGGVGVEVICGRAFEERESDASIVIGDIAAHRVGVRLDEAEPMPVVGVARVQGELVLRRVDNEEALQLIRRGDVAGQGVR